MKRLLICFVFFTLGVSAAEAQSNQQKEAQAFILKVVSEYKNPLAYYPFNRELFLPTQAEVDSIENAINKHALYYSSPFIVLGPDDSLKREIFLDAYGQPMFPQKITYSKSSQSASHQFFRRKQNRLLNANPNLGKFLLYNWQFKQSANPEKH
jgi:hypothetical protein